MSIAAEISGKYFSTPQDFYNNLDFWWDFLDPTKYTITGSTNFNYTQVQDKGPSGLTLTQSTSSLCPIFVNNVGAQFANDYMVGSHLIPSVTGTFFIVVRLDRVNGFETFISQGDNTIADGNAATIRKEGTGSGFLVNGLRYYRAVGLQNGFRSNIPMPTGTTNFGIYSVRKQFGEMRFGSTNVPTTKVGNVNSPNIWFNVSYGGPFNLLRVGALATSSTAANAGFTVKEMFMINRDLSDQEIVRLTNYLRIKYNILV